METINTIVGDDGGPITKERKKVCQNMWHFVGIQINYSIQNQIFI